MKREVCFSGFFALPFAGLLVLVGVRGGLGRDLGGQEGDQRRKNEDRRPHVECDVFITES
jgi:hypothetical protein